MKTLKNADSDPPRAERLSDIAYKRVLEHLFNKSLPAGSFVSQQQLVDLVDVPVGPLRDALRVLETEGVLIIHPRSGIEFVKPGLELTRSTYQYRSIIERFAVRTFAESAPADLIETLIDDHVALMARLDESELNEETLGALEDLERRLHDAIVGVLNNPLITSSHRRIHNYLRLVRLDRRLTPPVMLRSLREHLVILQACRARDADAAEEAIKDHFSAALQRHMGL